MQPTDPQISVVIITYNGASRIDRTLSQLRCQTVGPDAFDVLVVDDGSTDETAALAAAWGARVIRLPENRGAGSARNAGLDAVSTPLVAFIDDDCLPVPSWLENLLGPFSDLDVDGVGGRIVPSGRPGLILSFITDNNPWAPLSANLLRSGNPLYRLVLYLLKVLRAHREPQGDALFAVAGGNMAFRVDGLRDLGGFNPSLRVAEETDLCLRLHRRTRGARLVYRPQAEVSHRFETSLIGVLRRAHRYGQGTAKMAASHDAINLIVYPFPVAVALAIAASFSSRRLRTFRLLSPAVPLLTYFGWFRLAITRRRPSTLAYPYLQMATELATMAGEVQILTQRRYRDDRTDGGPSA
jgi:cellulose synthase/poly-beta-1,6-N-acetylglucosamine synthase-like glycosyltransferase